MSELREVFEMVTKQAEPHVDAWRQQEQRQRRKSRNRKVGALAIAAVIGVVAAVVVIRAVDDETGTQPGDTTGIPAEAIPPLPVSGVPEQGRYVFTSFDAGLDASHRISIDVPEGYWVESGLAIKVGTSQSGVATMTIGDVYADACQWKGPRLDPSTGSATFDVAAALASQKGLRVSTPTPVTVDGFAGTYMERRVPARTNLSDCDESQFRVYLVPGWREARYLVPGQLQKLWILDVDGVPLVIEASIQRGTSAELRAELRAELAQMVESVRIDPR